MWFRARRTPALLSGERVVRSIMRLTLKRAVRQLVTEFQAWENEDPQSAAQARKGYFLAVSRLHKVITSMEAHDNGRG